VNGLPHIHHHHQLCEACIFGKNHRIPFVKEPWRAKFLLELVHTDVYGPMNISSIGGNKYFLTFIDDFLRKTWIYLLKSKDEVFHCFKIFKAFVERQSLSLILQRIRFFYQRSKHIDIRYHFLRDQVGKNMVKLEYCRSEDQIADIFTH